MDRPRRESRHRNGITLRGLSQLTFTTKSALSGPRRFAKCLLFAKADIRRSNVMAHWLPRFFSGWRELAVAVFTSPDSLIYGRPFHLHLSQICIRRRLEQHERGHAVRPVDQAYAAGPLHGHGRAREGPVVAKQRPRRSCKSR